MDNYFTKINLKLDEIDLERLKGSFNEGYGPTFTNYNIKDNDYVFWLIKNKIKFVIEPDEILLTEITQLGCAPHTDEAKTALNYYIQCDESRTTFWNLKLNKTGYSGEQRQPDGSIRKSTVRGYYYKDLEVACTFSAKSKECYLLNVKQIHSVTKKRIDFNRYAIRWSWSHYDYAEIKNSIKIL
jgi:hypothetical protein